jgi:hypothetical protein
MVKLKNYLILTMWGMVVSLHLFLMRIIIPEKKNSPFVGIKSIRPMIFFCKLVQNMGMEEGQGQKKCYHVLPTIISIP